MSLAMTATTARSLELPTSLRATIGESPKIFKNVNDWLSFAEKKNTTILSVFGFITLFSALNFIKQFKSADDVIIAGCCFYCSA